VSTAIWIAVGVIGCIWLLIVVREVRYLSQAVPARPAPDRVAWIDDRARTETDMSRRAAWRSLRRAVQEEDEL
jgi:hypothetical protein